MTKEELFTELQKSNPEIPIVPWYDEEENSKIGIKEVNLEPYYIVFGKLENLKTPDGFHLVVDTETNPWPGKDGIVTNKGQENGGTVIELRLTEPHKIR